MFRALFIAMVLTLTGPVAAIAASLDPAQDAIVQKFFGELKANRVPAAYATLFSGTVMASKQQEMQMLVAQTSNVLTLYGKVSGWEPVSVNPIAPSFTQAIYLLKTDGVPVFFLFEFYNNGTRWVVTRITFNDTYAVIAGNTKP
jgi:hypothetical protein